MIRRLALAVLVTGFAAAASAALNPIETRKNLMKDNGFAAKTMSDMVKGDAPYDPVKAQLAMRLIYSDIVGFPFLFPEDSKTGGDTEAKPEIWQNKADFNARAEKLAADAWAGIEPAGKGLDSLKPAFQKVAQNCQGCHEQYRVKK
jgi:cytochrome c556